MKPAADEQNPRHWEKRVLAAYYRLLGSSQKAAGAAVGRSERSVWTWEQDTATWTRAMEEARKRWLGEVTAMARRQLLRGLMDADADLALKVIERLDPDLAPASLRLRHEGQVDLVGSPAWQQLRSTILAALAAYPEARIALAEVLTHGSEPDYEHRNGTNGTGR